MQHTSKFHNAISVIVVGLIVALTFASIANIYEQTTNYHHGWQVGAIAVGFAASFSVTVYIVMVAQTKATKIVAVIFALIFGYVSGKIQTELYITSGATFSVALAYGYGVPGFEAALAILEALLNMEAVRAKVKTMVDDLTERLQVVTNERLQLQTSNEQLSERINVLTNEQQQLNDTNVALNETIKRLQEQPPKRHPNVAPEQSNEQTKERRKQVVTIYKNNPNASYQDVADQVGVNKSVVWNDVNWLKQNEIVHVETIGKKTTVTVNGNEPQFMAS